MKVGATLQSLDRDVLGLVLQRLGCVRSLVALSAVNQRLRSLVSDNTAVWGHLMRVRMGLIAPQATLGDFGRAAAKRVWNWEDVFGDPVFWAQVVYCQTNVTCLFTREFSDTPVSAQLRKVQSYQEGEEDEEEEDERYGLQTLQLDLGRGGYVLHVSIARDCCLLLRVFRGLKSVTLMRLDGHPGGCGVSLREAKTLFALARGGGGFEDKYLWPLLWVATFEEPAERKARLERPAVAERSFPPVAAAVEWLEPRLREAWRGMIASASKMEELIADVTAYFDGRRAWNRREEDSDFLADLFVA